MEPNIEQYQKERNNIESASKTATEAGEDFKQIQEDVNKEIIKGLNQLSYFSVASISLSITFLGYLLSSDNAKSLLTSTVWNIELLWILYASWILLLASLVTGLLVRFWNSFYLYYEGAHHWTSSMAKFKEAMVSFSDKGYPIVFNDIEDKNAGMEELRKSGDKYKGISEENDKWKKFYFFLLIWGKRVAQVSFMLGMISLVLAIMLIVSKLVG